MGRCIKGQLITVLDKSITKNARVTGLEDLF